MAYKQGDLSAISLPRAHVGVQWIRDHKANLLIVLTINFLYCALFIWGRDGRNKGPAKFHAKCAFTCYICLRSSPGSPQL